MKRFFSYVSVAGALFLFASSLHAAESTFAKILKLYDVGTQADYADFDSESSLRGGLVWSNSPNNVIAIRGITLDLSDEVVGTKLVYWAFSSNRTDKEARENLADGRYAPLMPNQNVKAMTAIGSVGCRVRMYIRKGTSASGKQYLVGKTVLEDRRKQCNPSLSGNYNGQVANVHYVELPN